MQRSLGVLMLVLMLDMIGAGCAGHRAHYPATVGRCAGAGGGIARATVQPVVELPIEPFVNAAVPAGALRVVRAFGSDAWHFSEASRRGSPDADGATVPVWNSRFVYLMNAATGQPRAVLPLGPAQQRWESSVVAATSDRSGTQAAALLNNHAVLFWPALDRPPVALDPPQRVTLDHDDQRQRDVRAELFSTWLRPVDGTPPWPMNQARTRLAFSDDGAYLVVGEHVYGLRERRVLFGPAGDEVVLDLDDHGAIVARFAIDELRRSVAGDAPRVSRLVAIEYRPLDGPAVAYPGPTKGWPHAASAPEHWVAFDDADTTTIRDVITGEPRGPTQRTVPSPGGPAPSLVQMAGIDAIDVANDGTIAFVQAGQGWVANATSRRPLAVPTATGAARPTFDSIALGANAVFAVMTECERGQQKAVYAFDAAGRVRAAARGGFTARVSRSGHAVLSNLPELTIWSLAEAPSQVSVSYRANLDATDQSRAAAGGRRVVVQDTTRDARLFTVIDGSAVSRTLTVHGYPSPGMQWDVAADGSTLAAETTGSVHVLSLDDGSERFRAALTSRWLRTLGTSRQVTAAGEDDGLVRVWNRGREVRLDLAFRQDVATSLAISPDERWLAIGTARGLVLLTALE